MRKEFEMSEKDREVLMEAMKPVPMIALQCGPPQGPQESANAAWESLGRKMGFEAFTVRHVKGKGSRFFTAETARPSGVVIVFDGPPSHESGRFVEVERDGASIGFGRWVEHGDFWYLAIQEELDAAGGKSSGPGDEPDKSLGKASAVPQEASTPSEPTDDQMLTASKGLQVMAERLLGIVDAFESRPLRLIAAEGALKAVVNGLAGFQDLRPVIERSGGLYPPAQEAGPGMTLDEARAVAQKAAERMAAATYEEVVNDPWAYGVKTIVEREVARMTQAPANQAADSAIDRLREYGRKSAVRILAGLLEATRRDEREKMVAAMGLGKEVASAADEEAKTIYTDSGERYWADPGERPGSE